MTEGQPFEVSENNQEQRSLFQAESLRKASLVCKKFDIARKLGINSGEEFLFEVNLALRFLRAGIYDNRFIISQQSLFPLADIISMAKRLAHANVNLVEQEKAERSLKDYVEERTKLAESPEKRQRFRTLELAANDLAARATFPDDRSNETRIKVTKDLVEDWHLRWSRELGGAGKELGFQGAA